MPVNPAGQVLQATLGCLQAPGDAIPLRLVAPDRRPKRGQLAPGPGSLAGHIQVEPTVVAPSGLERGPVCFQAFLHLLQAETIRIGRARGQHDRGELVAAALQLRLQSRGQVMVGEGGPLMLDAALALDRDRSQPRRPGPQALDAGQALGMIVHPVPGQPLLVGGDPLAESVESGSQVGLLGRSSLALILVGAQPLPQIRDLAAGQMHPQRLQLSEQVGVPPGRLSLLLQGAQPPSHLPQQVAHPGQVAVGGEQASLGPFPPLAVLENPGSLLHHHPAVGGTGVEHRVDLALGHDHVLLAAHARVGQQFDDVQQPARSAVQPVGRLAVAEQGAGYLDLAGRQGQHAVGVVDGQRHLGSAQWRLVGRAREDHVVHPRGADRARRLGTQDPCHRVHYVRLAAAVGADDHGDTRFQPDGGRLGEGLEALQRQRLQIHGRDASSARSPFRASPARSRLRPGCRSSRSRCRGTWFA